MAARTLFCSLARYGDKTLRFATYFFVHFVVNPAVIMKEYPRSIITRSIMRSTLIAFETWNPGGRFCRSTTSIIKSDRMCLSLVWPSCKSLPLKKTELACCLRVITCPLRRWFKAIIKSLKVSKCWQSLVAQMTQAVNPKLAEPDMFVSVWQYDFDYSNFKGWTPAKQSLSLSGQ